MSQVLAVSAGFPGAGRVLQELSRLNSNILYVNLAERTELVREPELLILAAWHPIAYPKVIEAVKAKRTVVLWTSPPIQSEFTPVELDFLKGILHLLDSGKIHALWVGSEEWRPILKEEGRKVFYCPYPVSLPEWKSRERSTPPKDVSLFGPLSPRKNVLTQVAAAKMAGCKLHITDNSAVPILAKFSAAYGYHAHGWLPEAEYGSLIEKMDMGLQVSLPGVESFSFVCWDHLSRDVPCLTSVRWAPTNMWVHEPFNPERIVSLMKSNSQENYQTGAWRKWAERFAEERNREVKDIFKEELGVED